MTKLITLSRRCGGEPVYVNPEFIKYIYPYTREIDDRKETAGSNVVFNDDKQLSVLESPGTIFTLIELLDKKETEVKKETYMLKIDFTNVKNKAKFITWLLSVPEMKKSKVSFDDIYQKAVDNGGKPSVLLISDYILEPNQMYDLSSRIHSMFPKGAVCTITTKALCREDYD